MWENSTTSILWHSYSKVEHQNENTVQACELSWEVFLSRVTREVTGKLDLEYNFIRDKMSFCAHKENQSNVPDF